MEDDTDHGIAAAYYANMPGGLEATLECLCDAVFQALTWQEAGAEFDAHLQRSSHASR